MRVATLPSGIQIATHRPAPIPEPPSPLTVAELHPLPWSVGECHESMATLWDANGHLVVRLGAWLPNKIGPGDIAEFIAERLNHSGGTKP